jgi:phosphate transport system substrate-binding protein
MKRYFLILMALAGISAVASFQPTGIINGAGATFPYPLYKTWISSYQIEKNILISYLPKGSSSGLQMFKNKELDFCATDAFLSDEELENFQSEVLHIPTCLGAIVLVYNLPGNPELRFTPELISRIFKGEITSWKHPDILKHNPELVIPDMEVTVIHRSDGSGSTFIFTDYLSKIDGGWKEKYGAKKSVRWPVGIGVEGNQNVAEFVRKIRGGISYVSMTYAIQENLPMAVIQNRSGNYISPDTKTVSNAADIDIPDDTRVLLTDTPAPDGYPISGFSYVLVYREQSYNKRPKSKAMALYNFLIWSLEQGQTFSAALNYAPIPDKSIDKSLEIVQQITYQDTSLYAY